MQNLANYFCVESSSTTPAGWQFRLLLCSHLAIILLLLSFFFSFWQPIDQAVFAFLNRMLQNHSTWQIFWAISNHSFIDWIEDLFILGFYCLSIFSSSKLDRKKRVWQFIFCLIFIAFTILLINRLLCRDILRLRRSSPTFSVEGSLRLSQLLPWLDIKDSSSKSFPGDHATTALLFGVTYAFFAGRRFGFYGLLFSLFLCLPRLMVGAHWFSDLVVGSGSIVLFAMSWLLFTPLGRIGPNILQKILAFRKAAS